MMAYLNVLGIGFNPAYNLKREEQELYPLNSQEWQMPELYDVFKATYQIFLYGIKVEQEKNTRPLINSKIVNPG